MPFFICHGSKEEAEQKPRYLPQSHRDTEKTQKKADTGVNGIKRLIPNSISQALDSLLCSSFCF
jgi:hypothetical protein